MTRLIGPNEWTPIVLEDGTEAVAGDEVWVPLHEIFGVDLAIDPPCSVALLVEVVSVEDGAMKFRVVSEEER